MSILVTGGCGFIGSNFLIDWHDHNKELTVNLDLLTYSGNPENLSTISNNSNYIFKKGNISDSNLIKSILEEYQPRAIIHFAAESHVDRSILGPSEFIQTNILGTFNLLECARGYWEKLTIKERQKFRFFHVSTDEVYGSLSLEESPFIETSPYRPNSPYSASKASSDHLVRSWSKTYGLPVITSNCSNNYGPYQFPEKLIPLVITRALAGEEIPIYGDGGQIRDWLFVGDHCSAIRHLLEKGLAGEVYNIGGFNEETNLNIVTKICSILDELSPSKKDSYKNLIRFIADRPGHDFRYAIDSSKINQTNWKPNENLNSGLKKTVNWYLQNRDWLEDIISGNYREWIDKNYSLDS